VTNIANFDDDVFYGGYYLYDSPNTMKFPEAHLVGKFAVYFTADHVATLRSPGKKNSFTDVVTQCCFCRPS
jgi:hypothetical protein